jgi:hypothetical protein
MAIDEKGQYVFVFGISVKIKSRENALLVC